MFRLGKSELIEPEFVVASTWNTEEEGTEIVMSPLEVWN
jgi:hypothetical protein